MVVMVVVVINRWAVGILSLLYCLESSLRDTPGYGRVGGGGGEYVGACMGLPARFYLVLQL